MDNIKIPVSQGVRYSKVMGWYYFCTYNHKDHTDVKIQCKSKEEAESYMKEEK